MSNKPQILQRRLVATLKSICARRRDGWKKSFKANVKYLNSRNKKQDNNTLLQGNKAKPICTAIR